MDDKIQNKNLIKDFLENLISTFKFTKTIIIDDINNDEKFLDSYEIKGLTNIRIKTHPNFIIKTFKDNKYDLIFESFPFGMNMLDWIDVSEKKRKLPAEYIFILESLKHLNENGMLTTVVPSSILFSRKGKELESIVNSLGFYFSAAFKLPDQFLLPNTSTRTILLSIRKGQNEKIFISELDYLNNYTELFKNYFEGSSGTLEEGVFLSREGFISIENYKITQQISKLNTQYKNYKEYNIEDVSFDIKSTTGKFEKIENTIYIPRVGSSPPVSDIEEATLKHQNYFQVLLKPEIVISKYVEVFFKSQLGNLILATNKKYSFIPKINKSDLSLINIPIPDIETQKLIVDTRLKIEQLEEEIKGFKDELSVNPKSARKIQNNLNATLHSLGKLNEEEQIFELIRQGESKKLEFKKTFTRDVDRNIKENEKTIRMVSLKNIVAFLNSDGGTLLIGVDNDGGIYGIENDYFENDDKYLLNFKNNIKDHLGEIVYPFVDWKIVEVSNKKVLRVDCKPSSSDPFFLDSSEFYVRTNPSVDKLVGPKMAYYIKIRFNK
jgi:hypothetical protein